MVQQAGFVSFIRTVLIIVAVYYGLKWLFRLLIPYLIKRFINKRQEQFNQQYGADDRSNVDPEGKVKVKSRVDHEQREKDLGEYVDYEEIDEKENKDHG